MDPMLIHFRPGKVSERFSRCQQNQSLNQSYHHHLSKYQNLLQFSIPQLFILSLHLYRLLQILKCVNFFLTVHVGMLASSIIPSQELRLVEECEHQLTGSSGRQPKPCFIPTFIFVCTPALIIHLALL